MRDLPLGNGSLLVNFDSKYQIRDIYFPHIGQENHTCGYPFRLGVWVGGRFSWTFADDWHRDLRYATDAVITDVKLESYQLGIRLRFCDTVCDGLDVFLRKVEVTDLTGGERDVRVFLHHDLRIYENKIGDTAFYDPQTLAIVHYKKHRYFLINTLPHFDQFATGRKDFQHHEGTWRDAEDGVLHAGAITEGSVDSTIAIHGTGTFEFYYWLAAGRSHDRVADLNKEILRVQPGALFEQRAKTDSGWLNASAMDLGPLPEPVAEMYRRSLLITRTHIDTNGAIIAATDHEVSERATDHYAYLWPRDGAFIANALDMAGYPEFTQRFLRLCKDIIDDRGYFLQKYNPDGTVGSGWHAFWDAARHREMVPIQEDETALVLWCAWQHYLRFGNAQLAHEIYPDVIKPAADFLMSYRDQATGLPLPSWNLWEDRRGVHTFTCSTIVAGLRGAAGIAELTGDNDRSKVYAESAKDLVIAMRKHLFIESLGRFIRGFHVIDDDSLVQDTGVDASLFGLFYFRCFEPEDPSVVSTMKAIEETLYVSNGEFGGVARFENDGYMRVMDDGPGNPWIICTLWLAEYYIAAAETEKDLGAALEVLEWVARLALPSGVLAEQVHPQTGQPLSVSPLTWSHSTFVATAQSYLSKLRNLRGN